MNYFIIENKLPSLNEYTNACRRNAYVGAKFKKETEEEIIGYIMWARAMKTLKKVKEYPVELDIEWHEKTKKRDVDNIRSAVKFILDAMVTASVIENDNRKFVSQIKDTIVNDKKDYVKVTISE